MRSLAAWVAVMVGLGVPHPAAASSETVEGQVGPGAEAGEGTVPVESGAEQDHAPAGPAVGAGAAPSPPAERPVPMGLTVAPPPEDDDDLSAEEMVPLDDGADAAWEDEASLPRTASPEWRLAQSRVRGGGILVGTGLVLGFGALALGLSDPCARAGGNSCSSASRNRAAWTMAAPAVALLAAGGALLGVGLRDRRALRAAVVVAADGVVTVRGWF